MSNLIRFVLQLRKLGDDADKDQKALEEGKQPEQKEEKLVPVANPEGVVREVKEKRVVSREEREETKEVEDVQHLGDITDEVTSFMFVMIEQWRKFNLYIKTLFMVIYYRYVRLDKIVNCSEELHVSSSPIPISPSSSWDAANETIELWVDTVDPR